MTLMASDLQVISRTEETSLMIGTYILGPTVSGITICLLLCLVRYGITNPKNNNIAHYLVGVFSMLFTVLLNISFCMLGTDLIVPWNDNQLLLDDYDNNTMLEFTSLCIFLWYFGKLLYYISFVYYTYTTLSIPSPSKLYFRSFIYVQIIVTLLSVITLIYLNHNMYQIAITPAHNIQVVTQLKGYFFNIHQGIKLTEIASMVPLFTDLSTFVALLKIYTEKTQQLRYPGGIPVPRKHIELALRSIMLLCFGSIPSWILYVNIFMKSSIVWLLIPYDMLINNVCLFLMYSENRYLYNIICLHCHKVLIKHCIPIKVAPKDDQQGCDIVPSKSESMNKHKFNANHRIKHGNVHDADAMDGLQIHTDDEISDAHRDHMHHHPDISPAPAPLPPPPLSHDKHVFGQFLSVRPSYKDAKPKPNGRYLDGDDAKEEEMELKYDNEGKLSMDRSRSAFLKAKISPSPSASLSTSNIIKAIVMGADKGRRRSKSYNNAQYLRKRGIDAEIEESLQLSIKSASKLSSETSVDPSVDPSLSYSSQHEEESKQTEAPAFEVAPLCLTPSYIESTDHKAMNNDNGMNKKGASCSSSSSASSSSSSSSSSSGSGSSSTSSSSSSSSSSGSGSSDNECEDGDDTTDMVAPRRRYVHNRSTIDLANVIQKELSIYDDEEQDGNSEEHNEDNTVSNSVSMANVGVPSFGHHVHFSFFE